jgi:hypothetical protein
MSTIHAGHGPFRVRLCETQQSPPALFDDLIGHQDCCHQADGNFTQ